VEATPTAQATAAPTQEPTAEPTQEPAAEPSQEPDDATIPYEERPLVRVATLQGPTGMGVAPLMDKNDKQETKNRYEFTLVSAPEEIVALITSGQVDVAAMPTNLVASLYQSTGASSGGEGKVRLSAIVTLGVLYVLERGESIQSIQDLAGKTIHATGKGSTPEYALNNILRVNGLDDVTVEYHGEHAELMTLAAAGQVDIAMLPEPFVTNLLSQAPDMRVALDISKEWQDATGTQLVMSGLGVAFAFADEHPDVLNTFLGEYEESVTYANANVAETAQFIEAFGVMPSAAVAEKALPNCNITFIAGEDMKAQAISYYTVLHEANPKSIGGAMPDDAFYYNFAE
jgi:NitT/TauT family transport system substrate-binding protein